MTGRNNGQRGGAVLLMSVPLRSQAGPVAIWITAAGWAAAAEAVLGRAWLVSPNGLLDPDQARALATTPARRSARPDLAFRWLPDVVKVLLKDLRDALRAYRFRNKGVEGPWNQCTVRLVWQRHDLFQTAGLHAARRFGCPLVVFVDAPVVWEARRWGVRRPGWGWLLEAIAEKPMLRKADLVACVSDEVAQEVQRLGVSPRRVIVTPCSVDAQVFHCDVDGATIIARYGLKGRFVVGWTGSFRKFHGVEVLLDAFARLQHAGAEASLLLVGDGAERQRLEELSWRMGLRDTVVFTGTVPHDEVPSHIAAMDVAVLTAPTDVGFHYSPLKLKEYMACGRAIVAPRAGQIPSSLSTRREGLLVEAGDAEGLAEALRELYSNPDLRSALGGAAAKRAQAEGTWEHQMNRALERLSALAADSETPSPLGRHGASHIRPSAPVASKRSQ